VDIVRSGGGYCLCMLPTQMWILSVYVTHTNVDITHKNTYLTCVVCIYKIARLRFK